jgi:ribosome biogenesis protein Nip4
MCETPLGMTTLCHQGRGATPFATAMSTRVERTENPYKTRTKRVHFFKCIFLARTKVNKTRTKVNRTETKLKQDETQIGENPQQNRKSEKSEHPAEVGGHPKLRRPSLSGVFVASQPNATERFRLSVHSVSSCSKYRFVISEPNVTERNRTIFVTAGKLNKTE